MIPYYSPLRETNAHGTGMVRERDMRKSMAVMIAATADTLATKSFVAKSAFDRTHVGPKGAGMFAGMVAQELVRLIPSVAPSLK